MIAAPIVQTVAAPKCSALPAASPSRRMLLRLASRALSAAAHPALAPRRIAPAGARSVTAAAMASGAAVQADYEKLCGHLRVVSALSGISGLLGWDEQVMMPDGAAAVRAAQNAALAGVVYEKETAPELGQLLERVAAALAAPGAPGAEGLGEFERANVRKAARNYRRTTALPKSLVERAATLSSEGYHAWVKARGANDFALFAPTLQAWLDLSREKAALIDPSRPAYDVLLDDYEAGMTAARLDEIFAEVKAGVVPLLAKLRAAGARDAGAPRDGWLRGGPFDEAAQAALCRELALAIGFDVDRGRLDVSVHPFTGGAHPNDVRMTTRFKPDDLTEGITGAIHETGHALYEQGRNAAYDGLPVSEALSMGVHESQSLLWERMVGLGLPFCTYLLPKLYAAFPQLPPGKTPMDLYRAFNIVRPTSFIRVEADEVAYPLHVLMRYELERDLLSGKLPVRDLPQAWNAKMREYLGAAPESDAQGVLQDVHWSSGAIGYFPTYTLGAMYAAQLFAFAKTQLPGLEETLLTTGDFAPLKAWLNAQVHVLGSMPPSGDELMARVTGAPLRPAAFVKYLEDKFGALYP